MQNPKTTNTPFATAFGRYDYAFEPGTPANERERITNERRFAELRARDKELATATAQLVVATDELRRVDAALAVKTEQLAVAAEQLSAAQSASLAGHIAAWFRYTYDKVGPWPVGLVALGFVLALANALAH